MNSRLQDPPEKFAFSDQHWVRVEGGHGIAEATAGVIYLALALRNVGRGMGVLHGWTVETGIPLTNSAEVADPAAVQRPDLARFRRLTRDLYVPAGDLGFWQGALRDPADPNFAEVTQAIEHGQLITIFLLYGDHEGGQRMISRFALLPLEVKEGHRIWLGTVGRHWHIDGAEPR